MKTIKIEKYNSIGDEEVDAATEVIKSGCLSNYLGTFNEKFFEVNMY